MDKTTKTYYNKFNMYPERVLEVPHGGASFFAEIPGIFWKSLRKERKKRKTVTVTKWNSYKGKNAKKEECTCI